MTEVTTLAIPLDLKMYIEEIAAKDFPPKKWSDKAREMLWGIVSMHKSRGNV